MEAEGRCGLCPRSRDVRVLAHGATRPHHQAIGGIRRLVISVNSARLSMVRVLEADDLRRVTCHDRCPGARTHLCVENGANYLQVGERQQPTFFGERIGCDPRRLIVGGVSFIYAVARLSEMSVRHEKVGCAVAMLAARLFSEIRVFLRRGFGTYPEFHISVDGGIEPPVLVRHWSTEDCEDWRSRTSGEVGWTRFFVVQ